MSRHYLLLVLLALTLGALPSLAVNYSVPIKQNQLAGDEPLPLATYYPTQPGTIAQSPGDTAGWTQYDYQTNGSTGNRVVIDSLGYPHCSWMYSDLYPSLRDVHFNCKTSGGWPFPGGIPVSYRNMDGYTSISLNRDNRAVIAYHNANVESSFVAIDELNCLGFFRYYAPPCYIDTFYGIWPNVSVDHNDYIHYTMTTLFGGMTLYTRSTDGGTSWSAVVPVDTTTSISTIVTSSPVSNKTAIVYLHQNPDSTVDATYDVYYIQSVDGTTWDWLNGKVNVTNYGPDDDSVSAQSDVDAVYDYNDNLHIVWNAHYATSTYYWIASSWFYHYSSASGDITAVAESDTVWVDGCDMGAWNWHFCKMSIGAEPGSNALFTVYTDFDSSDCSSSGYANGDIYAHWSSDGGATWSRRVNLTNSHTPGCFPGDCDSDHWGTMAEKVNGYLHLFYVNDKDAGGIPQTEGSVTDNPMLYYAVPAGVVAVDDPEPIPKTVALAQNYPNPFNAQTKIEFTLDKGADARLAVYDITGALVKTLVNARFEAGKHEATWSPGEVSSGVYFYRLSTNEGSRTRRMVLLK
jgi:hypothetical protein